MWRIRISETSTSLFLFCYFSLVLYFSLSVFPLFVLLLKFSLSLHLSLLLCLSCTLPYRALLIWLFFDFLFFVLFFSPSFFSVFNSGTLFLGLKVYQLTWKIPFFRIIYTVPIKTRKKRRFLYCKNSLKTWISWFTLFVNIEIKGHNNYFKPKRGCLNQVLICAAFIKGCPKIFSLNK